jgi:hypothetical protein
MIQHIISILLFAVVSVGIIYYIVDDIILEYFRIKDEKKYQEIVNDRGDRGDKIEYK